MHEVKDPSAGLAAAAFTVFACALAAWRVPGDRLVERCGRSRVVRVSGAAAAAGALVAVLAPTAAPSLAGWALLGVGVAALAPTIRGAAAKTGSVSPGVAIAAVTTLGYLGSFTGPPLIGGLAELIGLSAALGLLILTGLVLAALTPRAFSRAG